METYLRLVGSVYFVAFDEWPGLLFPTTRRRGSARQDGVLIRRESRGRRALCPSWLPRQSSKDVENMCVVFRLASGLGNCFLSRRTLLTTNKVH